MIHTEKTVRTLQAVAMTVGIAVFLWSTGLPTIFRFAEAASITNASDTLSNSAPSQASNHTIAFRTANGLSIGQTIELTFPVAFTMGSVGEDDIDILVASSSSSTAAAAGADTWGVTVAGSVVTLETPTNSGVASNTPIVVRIGNHAVTSGTGVNQITNPSATTTSYAIDIAGSMQDSGQVRVAIIDQVIVSANVDTSLTFSVAGVNNGQLVNGTTTTGTSTNIALPFGTLGINNVRTLAHDLSVTTNATNGFNVTVVQTGELQSTTGATIDGFIDGLYTVTPSPWQAPDADILFPDTYGHWGITSDDAAVPARTAQFASNQWVSGSTTPIAIMGHTGPSDGTLSGYGASRIGYQVEISALQEAGDDYTTTLRYIATPTF